MTVEFLVEAEHELAEATLWYESKQRGLGQRFKMEVQFVLQSIALNPLLH